MSSRPLLLVIACLMGVGLAQPLWGQESSTWHIASGVGRSDIHQNRSSGFGWAAHVERSMTGAGRLVVAAGLLGGSADEGFLAMDAGVAFRILPGSAISPFIGLGGGVMTEPEYRGPFLRASGGVALRVASRASVRLTVQRGTHDGQSGPHLATVGLGWSPGRSSR